MRQLLLINRIRVQNANAIAGFTWGFPAITHFLGFSHSLSLKVNNSKFKDLSITGCSVISHEHQVHTYGEYEKRFSQTKISRAMHHDKKDADKASPVIEEGKMNMTVSLLIKLDGSPGNQTDQFTKWIKKQCLLQRLAGGTILDIETVQIFNLNDPNKFYLLKQKLLPGFVLMDRADYLIEHHKKEVVKQPDKELFDSWLDFAALKQSARPKTDHLTKHLTMQTKNGTIEKDILSEWEKHLEKVPFEEGSIPQQVIHYFESLEPSNSNKSVLTQWENYKQPTNKTPADWEYIPKPNKGYLVPLMTGYKAISEVYNNEEIDSTRDNETPVCFVETVHSVGEWLGANNLKNADDITGTLWEYSYEDNWYLCRQSCTQSATKTLGNDKTTETYDLS